MLACARVDRQHEHEAGRSFKLRSDGRFLCFLADRLCGGGDTENARYSTAVKYRIDFGAFRAAALWQFGGYAQNNTTDGALEGQLGGDLRLGRGTLSFDAIYNGNTDAVALSLAGAPTNAQGVPTGTMLPQTLTATLSDNTSVMALTKYTFDRIKLYAGYEWMQFAPQSDPFTVKGSGFIDIAGDPSALPAIPRLAGQTSAVRRRFQRSSVAGCLGGREILHYRFRGHRWRLLSLRPEQLRRQCRQQNRVPRWRPARTVFVPVQWMQLPA
jgi:hypothetical protein